MRAVSRSDGELELDGGAASMRRAHQCGAEFEWRAVNRSGGELELDDVAASGTELEFDGAFGAELQLALALNGRI